MLPWIILVILDFVIIGIALLSDPAREEYWNEWIEKVEKDRSFKD